MSDTAKDILTQFLRAVALPQYRDRLVHKVSSLPEYLAHKFDHAVKPKCVVAIPHAWTGRNPELWAALAGDEPVVCVGSDTPLALFNVQRALEELDGFDSVLIIFNQGRSAFFEDEAGAGAVHWVIAADDTELKRVKAILGVR